MKKRNKEKILIKIKNDVYQVNLKTGEVWEYICNEESEGWEEVGAVFYGLKFAQFLDFSGF